MAGGYGNRLRSVVQDRSKVVAEVAGRPFLHYLLRQLQQAGLQKIVLCTGYLSKSVKSAIDADCAASMISYSEEDQPLGTGGALRLALPLITSDTVLVLNGDSYCGVDLKQFVRHHHSSRARASMLLTRVADTSRYGTVTLRDGGEIEAFVEKDSSHGPGFINAGVYLLPQDLLQSIAGQRKVSLERDIFPKLLGQGFYGYYEADACFIDIGTPESYAQAQAFFLAEKL